MRKIASMIMVLCFMALLCVSALAESITQDGWTVTFTAGSNPKMVQDFGNSNENRTSNSLNRMLDDDVRGLQPGDDITFSIVLKNDNDTTTNWYMTNEVLDSLEDNSANTATHGGAYTYRLVYNGTNGEEVLFDSETVGGDAIVSRDREGLNEATASLENFFYLDTLAKGGTGTVTLHVALDGETQGNDYQDTLADLQMNFAVELTATETPKPDGTPSPDATPNPGSPPGTVVRTGDDYKLVPYYIAMSVSGVLFLILAVDSIRRRRKEAGK